MARILVIDDSPSVALSVSKLLRADGHQVEAVSDVQQVPGYLRESRPDLILLDLEMPGLSGVEYAAFMRRSYAGRLLMVIHSSQPWAALQEAARQVDAVGIVPKGAAADAVRCIINSALRRTSRALG